MKEARLAEIAYRTAEDIFDRVKDYCEKIIMNMMANGSGA
jgi:hypothetical protein